MPLVSNSLIYKSGPFERSLSKLFDMHSSMIINARQATEISNQYSIYTIVKQIEKEIIAAASTGKKYIVIDKPFKGDVELAWSVYCAITKADFTLAAEGEDKWRIGWV